MPPRVQVNWACGRSEVAQSFDWLKLCGSSSQKAADFEQHEVCGTLAFLLPVLRNIPVPRGEREGRGAVSAPTYLSLDRRPTSVIAYIQSPGLGLWSRLGTGGWGLGKRKDEL